MAENITIIDFIRMILRDLPEFENLDTWAIWFIVLKSIFGLPLSGPEFEIFKLLTKREAIPTGQVRQAWILAGRRSGKSFISAIILCYLAIFRKWKHGRHGNLVCLANDKKQAGAVFSYCCDIFSLPILKPYVSRILAEEIELKNGLEIGVHVCSYRSLRGYRVLCAVLDELVFYNRAESDPEEIIRALMPSLNENEDSLLLAISSVYGKFGLAYETFCEGYGKNEDDRIIFKAATRDLNPNFSQRSIDDAIAKDPQGASAEYLSEWRSDRETYLPSEIIEAAIMTDRYELEARKGVDYVAFCDPSGGSHDSMTIAIAHREGKGAIVLDCLREMRPPFNPEAVAADFSRTLKDYRLQSVTGDKYAGSWVSETFRKFGITYKNSELTKSELYLSFLPLMMAKRVELLDSDRLLKQLRALERRTGGSRDSVDHPMKGMDDVINAAAGACVLAAAEKAGGYFAVAEKSMLG